jgi:hypothetical protein
MNGLWQEIRNGVSVLGRHPGFTATVGAALAVGIALQPCIFSVLVAVILRLAV